MNVNCVDISIPFQSGLKDPESARFGTMMATSWDAHKIDFPSLEIELSGTPDYYFAIVRGERESEAAQPSGG
jgi:hypothetical protein